MIHMDTLKGNPFFLDDEDIKWIENTLSKMDLKTKVGQLFCPVGLTEDTDELKKMLDDIKPSGIMFRTGDSDEMQRIHRFLQDNSEIPMLIAANLEAGGTGIANDGTYFGCQMQVAATNDDDMAYKLGLIAGREGRAVGCNWAFAPVIDIDYNFRNPITNTRTFGSSPDRVLSMGRSYMRGIHEAGLAVSIKHFPGDGVDDRDQHLLTSTNDLSCEEWEATFGKVYQGMIDSGASSLMVGHIMLPEYSRKLVPGIRDEEIMPATLAPELIQDLLIDKMGFKGLIVTDATPMVGFAAAGKREYTVPKAIASGCDMFLFNKSLEEDFGFMMKGIDSGILTLERVDEAVTKILAFKASLGLHKKKATGELVPSEKALSVLQCEEHKTWAKSCADKSVTLVKDTQNLLPLSLEKHKRALIIPLGDTVSLQGNDGGKMYLFAEKFKEEGFETTVFDKSTFSFKDMMVSTEEFTQPYDVAIYISNLKTASNQTTVRIDWAPPMGIDAPWFIHELPTLFISFANPYHLQDVPRIKTFINGYTCSEFVIDAVIDKMLGRTDFNGISPVDPFCGYWEAKL